MGKGIHSITAGADGNLWFADSLNNRIWKMNTDGVIIGDYLVDSCPGFAGFGPHGITAGPDGAVWFAHLDCNYIGRIATGTKRRPALAANYFLTAIEGCPILAFLPDRSTNSTARCT